jgi:peptidoglycan hydrolase-like protein with peptidoglycan-binding domain
MPDVRPLTFPSAIGLSEGTTGSDVEKLQEFLQRFGYLQIPAGNEEFSAVRAATSPPNAILGEFDKATVAALNNFQQFHGLPSTGILDEATVKQMSQPRCGFPDIPSNEGVDAFLAQGNRWNRTNLTYGFQEFTPDLLQPQVRGAITSALNLWSQVTPLRFTEIPLASNPDFIIRFVANNHGDGSPFDGIGRVLAHAFSPPPNAGNIAGDAHFDEDETWTVNIPVPANTIDLVTVAAHEFGHSLGLAHSSVAGALMFPSYSGPQRFLAQDDIDGIQSIYGKSIGLIPSLYNYGGGDTALFIFTTGSFAPQQVWRSGAGNFEWERAKLVIADVRGVGKELCILYNYDSSGGGDTALFVFPAGSFAPQQIWRSGAGNFEWERAKLSAADVRGVGKSELCILYNYDSSGGGDTALFVFPAGSSAPQQIWRSGAGNFEWGRAKLGAADIQDRDESELCMFYNYGNDDTALFIFSAGSSAPKQSWRSGVGNWSWDRMLV